MKRTILIALVCILALSVLTATGCRRVPIDQVDGEVLNKSEVIEIGAAKRATVDIAMGAGELDLRSNAESGTILAVDCDYRPASWEPIVETDMRGDSVRASIKQPNDPNFNFGGGVRNRWDLSLGTGVPTDLSLSLGAGQGEIALGGSSVEQLEVDMGAGEFTIDLSGDWTADMEADIQAGVGELTLIVPEGVGVRVDSSEEGVGDTKVQGLESRNGYYVNDAYGTSPVTLEIRIRQGVGEIRIETAS